MSSEVKIILKSGKDQSLRRFHPWVFSGAIKKIYGHPSEGSLVKVYSNKDEFLGQGHYQSGSIAVRILSWTEVLSEEEFCYNGIKKAIDYRKNTGLIDHPETNVFRLINAEGDGLPGLIADYYNGTVVVQFHSTGMFLSRDRIVSALQEILGHKLLCVYDKSEGTLPGRAGDKPQNTYLLGEKQDVEVREYGNAFLVDCLTLWKIACGRDFDLSFSVLLNERLLKNSSKFIASPRARAPTLFPCLPYHRSF